MDRKLICHTDLIMRPIVSKGSEYRIVNETTSQIAIRNDVKEPHWFDKHPVSESYYGRWFHFEGEEAPLPPKPSLKRQVNDLLQVYSAERINEALTSLAKPKETGK